MARPVALSARSKRPFGVVRPSGVLVALLLALFVAWPLAGMLTQAVSLPMAGWPWRIALQTLGVTLVSACVSFVLALLIALSLIRVGVPGRDALWRMFGLCALIPPFIIPLALLLLSVPGGALGWLPRGFAAVVVGQSLAFLPSSVVLVGAALARIPSELEQAAEVLGASRSTILRRVTFALAGRDVGRAALVVFGLCLADLVTPLLLGGDIAVLTTAIVALAAVDGHGAAASALLLAALASAVALTGGAWRSAAAWIRARPALPRLDHPVPPALRWGLGAIVWMLVLGLAALWAIVPVGSILRTGRGGAGVSFEHWVDLATGPGVEMFRNSVLLGLGVALLGTALALATAFSIERGAASSAWVVERLARVPLIVPGIAVGVGYLLVVGGPPVPLVLTLPILIAVIACWELPVTSRAVQDVLIGSDRSDEDAAIGLGAGRLTALARIVVPTLRPVVGWLLGYLFAVAVLVIGTVAAVTGAGRYAAALAMLTLAAAGATGAACAVATALLALAGGAVLLGRAIAGRPRGSTLLA